MRPHAARSPMKVKSKVFSVLNEAPRHEDVWGLDVWLHYSWPQHYIEVSDQLHAPAASSPSTHCIGGWVVTGLDTVESRKISCPFRVSNTGRPPIRRRCIDWAILAPSDSHVGNNLLSNILSGDKCTLYSGCDWFESWPGHWLCW
jgi:hypothetical protein